MTKFDKYFSQEMLAAAVVHERMRACHTRGKLAANCRVVGEAEPSPPSEVDGLMPPRSEWIRPGRRWRQKHERAQERALIRKVCSELGMSKPWAVALRRRIRALQRRALPSSKHHRFTEPRVSFHRKDEPHKYRPIVSYPLRDKIIIGQTARYLDDWFRPQRSSRVFSGYKGRARAVEELRAYRLRHHGELWVAECDIQNFFDSVGHEIVRQRLVSASTRSDEPLDPRAMAVIEAMLTSYSFARTVVPAAAVFRAERDTHAIVKWPEDELRKYWGEEIDNIGIPQGAALSTVLADIVLDAVDRAVLDGAPDDLLYARYMDDTIIAHPDREVCAAAFGRLLQALDDRALPVHPPMEMKRYSANHWEAKSHAPYRWARRSSGTAPWVGFLGYQIRHDGVLRVRPSSIQRELDKQVTEVSRVVRAIRSGQLRKSTSAVRRSLAGRLVAMSVGRRGAGGGKSCWVAGFSLLREHPHLDAQLRLLDRNRQRQLCRLARVLGRRPVPPEYRDSYSVGVRRR